jgi:hypothetical protein
MSSAAIASPEEPNDPKNYPENIRWALAKEAVCKGFCNQREASERYGLSYDALRKRCEREEWPIPERVLKAVTELSHNRQIARETAVNWSEKAELAKVLAFDIASAALQKAKDAPLPLKDWSDIEKADKMARRAAGLDNGEGANVSVGFNFSLLGDKAEDAIEGEILDVPSQADTLPG